MPIYEYCCQRCECAFETLIWSARDAQEVTCPKCGSREVERLLSCFSSGNSLGTALGDACSSGARSFG
jgi:putative FmdB family regulatory protein